LFGEQGLDRVSIENITTKAKVNLAASTIISEARGFDRRCFRAPRRPGMKRG